MVQIVGERADCSIHRVARDAPARRRTASKPRRCRRRQRRLIAPEVPTIERANSPTPACVRTPPAPPPCCRRRDRRTECARKRIRILRQLRDAFDDADRSTDSPSRSRRAAATRSAVPARLRGRRETAASGTQRCRAPARCASRTAPREPHRRGQLVLREALLRHVAHAARQRAVERQAPVEEQPADRGRRLRAAARVRDSAGSPNGGSAARRDRARTRAATRHDDPAQETLPVMSSSIVVDREASGRRPMNRTHIAGCDNRSRSLFAPHRPRRRNLYVALHGEDRRPGRLRLRLDARHGRRRRRTGQARHRRRQSEVEELRQGRRIRCRWAAATKRTTPASPTIAASCGPPRLDTSRIFIFDVSHRSGKTEAGAHHRRLRFDERRRRRSAYELRARRDACC